MLLMLAMAANLDNLGVGIAYGIARNPIPPVSNLLIAVLTSALTYLAMGFGSFVALLLPAQVANGVGATILITIGIIVCWEKLAHTLGKKLRSSYSRFIDALKTNHILPKFNKRKTLLSPETNSRRHKRNSSRELALSETLMLGISLSLNAMAGGFGASLAGHNPVTISIAMGVFSYLTIAVAQTVSAIYFNKWLGTLAQKVAGLILIGIGLYELVFG
jgi:putative sporulation protein YtaF